MGEQTVVVGSADTPEIIVLRRRELTARWWWGPLLGLVGLVFGGVLLALEYREAGGRSPDPFPWIAVTASGVVALVLFARQRLRVDATGIGWRWVQSAHIPWAEIARVLPLQPRRGPEQLLVVRADGRGQVLGQPTDVAVLAAEIERRRPREAPARLVRPLAPAGSRPGRIMAAAAPGQWTLQAGSNVIAVLVMVGLAISSPWFDTRLRLVTAVGALFLVLPIVVTARKARAAIAADGDCFTAIRWGQVERLPMHSIERFVWAETFPSRPVLVALVDGRARRFEVPLGMASATAVELVEHLERLRSWVAAHPDDRPGPAEHDPVFRTRRPGPIARWAIPATALGIALLLMAAVPLGFVAYERSAEEIEARSLPTSGTVSAVGTNPSSASVLVEYRTTTGPMTTEVVLEPEQVGQQVFALRYDPQEPATVWPEGGYPPSSAWPFLLGFLSFVPLAIGVTLALRWHPPSATGRRAGLYDPQP